MYLSFQLEIPSGTTIVLVNALAFVVVLVVTARPGAAPRRRPRRPRRPADPCRSRWPCAGRIAEGRHADRLSPGDRAPDFALPDADGREVALASLRGPQGRSCTPTPPPRRRAAPRRPATSATACRRCRPPATRSSACPPTSPRSSRGSATQQGLTFPLLSDPDKAVLTAYGAYGEKKLYGKTVIGVIRSTFVLDEDGVVERAPTPSRPPVTSPSCGATSASTARPASRYRCSVAPPRRAP